MLALVTGLVDELGIDEPELLAEQLVTLADGVEHVLRCLLAEMDLIIALSGYASHRDLRPDMITSR
jgi:isopentenyl diphosphate isomerase/L-lactate dehydrogenase-like FMN-dependent dehydrogenase